MTIREKLETNLIWFSLALIATGAIGTIAVVGWIDSKIATEVKSQVDLNTKQIRAELQKELAPSVGQKREGRSGSLFQQPTSQFEDLLSRARKWPLIEKDVFSENLMWDVRDYKATNATGEVKIRNGKFSWSLETEGSHDGFARFAESDATSDFYLKVEGRLKSGVPTNAFYGVLFRESKDQYYYILIADSGHIKVLLWKDKKNQKITEWLPIGNIKAGEYNEIEVVGEGRQFRLYINSVLVLPIELPELVAGRVGLTVDLIKVPESQGPTHAEFEFDDFVYRRKP